MGRSLAQESRTHSTGPPRRRATKVFTVLALTALILAAMAFFAASAGASTCGNGTVNVSLNSGCASVLGVPVVGSSSSDAGKACADAAGCKTVQSPETTAPSTPAILPSSPAPNKKPAPHTAVRKSVGPITPQSPRRINFADADTAFFYEGTYRRALPYSSITNNPFAGDPVHIAPVIGSGSSWDFGSLPRSAALSLIAGLMLIVSAGGVRKLLTNA
jgi:hypothetical protein